MEQHLNEEHCSVGDQIGDGNGSNTNAADEDDSSVDSNLLYYEPRNLNEEVFDELKKNNRYIDTLWIWNNHPNDFDPLNIDWGKEGDSLSDNTHLKSVEIMRTDRESSDNAREQRYAERNARAFYRELSKNKSIKYLKIRGCIGNLAMSDTLSILSPFIENNTKLRSLELGGCRVNGRFAQIFESALSGCNTSLQRIELNRCEGMTADIMEKIINVVGSQGIQELYLDEYDWDDEVAAALGDTLCTNNTLKILSLGGEQFDHQEGRIGSMDSTGVEAVTDFLSTPSSSLKELSFRNNRIGPLGGIALAEALEGNTTLKHLDLYSAVSPWYGEHTLTSQGWTTFFESLHNCAFHSLNLGGNTIEDGDVASMVEALNSFSSLENLNLRKATSITSSGWVAFFNLMAQPGSAMARLKKLDIEGSNITDEVMISIASALVNNISLKQLGWCHRDSVADTGWSALTNALCNKTTIETICNSNHTLLRVGIISPGKVNKLARLNNGTNKTEVARQKIIRYYFLEGKGSNLHEIMNMDLVALPHVIECFGKQEMEVSKGTYGSARCSNGQGTKYTIKVDSGFELLYRLARGMPSLFDLSGKVVGGKRKRKA